MASREELERLDRLLSKQEKRVRDAFMEFVRQARSDEVLREVGDMLERGDINGAMGVVDRYIGALGSVLPSAFIDVGVATAAELADKLPKGQFGIHFDPTHPRAAEIMRQNRLEFVTEFSEEQRRATRAALVRAFETGQGSLGVARAFRDSIGLTETQEGAVANYERLLRAGSREVLDRALRDRRFDGTVSRAIANDEALSETQIDRMVSRYRERYLSYRSQVIARTEALRATSQAREEATIQTAEQADIPQSQIKRVWNTTVDGRTREWHASMQGQVRAVNEAFVDGHGNRLLYPGDPAAPMETTVSCRCVLTTEFELG